MTIKNAQNESLRDNERKFAREMQLKRGVSTNDSGARPEAPEPAPDYADVKLTGPKKQGKMKAAEGYKGPLSQRP